VSCSEDDGDCGVVVDAVLWREAMGYDAVDDAKRCGITEGRQPGISSVAKVVKILDTTNFSKNHPIPIPSKLHNATVKSIN